MEKTHYISCTTSTQKSLIMQCDYIKVCLHGILAELRLPSGSAQHTAARAFWEFPCLSKEPSFRRKLAERKITLTGSDCIIPRHGCCSRKRRHGPSAML